MHGLDQGGNTPRGEQSRPGPQAHYFNLKKSGEQGVDLHRSGL
jgi:hypothetical protein